MFDIGRVYAQPSLQEPLIQPVHRRYSLSAAQVALSVQHVVPKRYVDFITSMHIRGVPGTGLNYTFITVQLRDILATNIVTQLYTNEVAGAANVSFNLLVPLNEILVTEAYTIFAQLTFSAATQTNNFFFDVHGFRIPRSNIEYAGVY